MALVYATAFASFGSQATGLIGDHGILPIARLLERADAQLGGSAVFVLPTLLWIRSDDAALLAICWGGLLASVALLFGLAPRVTAAVLWLFYLSLVHAGQVFLGYQWDVLLLEAGLLAIWFAPAAVWVPLSRTSPPRAAPLFLLRWLLFRLFLSSGLVKLLSGDPSWPNLTAMTFHYWTQPLPNPVSPFVHALPAWFHRGETLATLAAELVLPFGVFGPRPLRLASAAGFVGLMLVINGTGNYGFFGPLACVLCIPLVDDAIWRRVPGLRRVAAPAIAPSPSRARRVLGVAAAVFVVAVTTGQALHRVARWIELPESWDLLLEATQPLASFNAYGLFANMTKDRPEIDVEGSRDGVTWLEYEFRYKPDRLDEAPPMAALHMPRLDWQMWFAALDDCGDTPWFIAFQRRLLEAEPKVLALLARDPFDGERPRYLRTTLYRYRFADGATRRATGAWWTREELGPYCPMLELDGDALRVVAP